MKLWPTVKTRLPLLLGAATAIAAVAMPILNPDLYWHLSAGRFMAENLRPPNVDFLSWTEYGAPWTDFEWLAQLLFYAPWALAGKTALLLFKTLILGAGLWTFYRLLELYSLESWAFFALPLWGLGVFPNSDLRPENFSLLFFSLLLWRLEKFRLSASHGPTGPAGYAAVAALFALWANLHAGFAYGLMLLLFYSAGAWLDSRLFRDTAKPVVPLLKAAGAGALGAALNPWGIKIYSVLLSHAADSSLITKYLQEWAPPKLSNPWYAPFFFFLAASFALLLRRFLRDRRLPAAHLILLTFFGFSAASHARHIAFFSICALAVSFESFSGKGARRKFPPAGIALFAAAVLYLAAAVWPRYAAFKMNPGEEAAGAADYLAASPQLDDRRLYNPWTWGGYLGWRLAPRQKVFVDGRYLFHKRLAPLSAAMADQDTWDDFSARQGFGLVLFRRDNAVVPVDTPDGRINRPAYLVFMPQGKWSLIYWDKYALLFAKRPAPVREFRLLLPGDFAYLKLALCAGGAGKKDLEHELSLYSRLSNRGEPAEVAALRDWLKHFPYACQGAGRN